MLRLSVASICKLSPQTVSDLTASPDETLPVSPCQSIVAVLPQFLHNCGLSDVANLCLPQIHAAKNIGLLSPIPLVDEYKILKMHQVFLEWFFSINIFGQFHWFPDLLLS